MILNLGVHEMAYAAQFSETHTASGTLRKKKKTFSKAQKGYGAGKTTGDIAEILEKNYGVMQLFFDKEKGFITEQLMSSMTGAIKNMVIGKPGPVGATNQAMSAIQTRFKQNLSSRAYDGAKKGIPTAAAEHGVSHRFKHPYAKRAARPSFIDTGLYQSSFTAWMED